MKQLHGLSYFCLVMLFGVLMIFGSGCSVITTENQPPTYEIDSTVVTTSERTIAYTAPPVNLQPHELSKVSEYSKFGYGVSSPAGPGLAYDVRTETAPVGIMPAGYVVPTLPPKQKLLDFFAITDVHITDKETPAQMIYLQQLYYPGPPALVEKIGNYPWSFVTSVYSPVMLYTTHVLDAFIQTVNALHKQPGNAFDFGISLGDVANSAQYNELRWYLDVIDGKYITPSSGAHAGADTIDYQKPYQAAGLDRTIPFYQTLGNHDHFFIGSFPVDANLRQTYIGDTVLAAGDVLLNPASLREPEYYMGVLDGSTPNGNIIKAGPVADLTTPPTVVADPDRRALSRTEFIDEFFNTTSNPVGHGFNLVDADAPEGFACYSFVPKSDIPLKVIVLDNTQRDDDGDPGIHGHGFLDEARWTWLKKELADGDAAGQLMIIAAHIPIGVEAFNSKMEWWDNPLNAVSLEGLVTELHSHPNFLMWIAGHRHVNAIKAFPGPTPEQGFWQVETSSLRDWPQQGRAFEIYLNADYTISIVATQIDPAVKEGTPAAISRSYAIAAQEITGDESSAIYLNPSQLIDLETQEAVAGTPDPSIKPLLDTNGQYNAILYKKLSDSMKLKMQTLFP